LLVGPPFTITDVEMDRLTRVVAESISAVYGD
jgi:adenosylmethionine-8-amino-7-oxononanoate aminotransferase